MEERTRTFRRKTMSCEQERIVINLSPSHFPVLTGRYTKDQILDMGLAILEKEGVTADQVTSANLGTVLANLESDLESMFPHYLKNKEGEEL